MPSAVVVLAEGFEEIEAVTPIDVLRRAEVEVYVAGLAAPAVRGSRGVTIQCDGLLRDAPATPDLVVLPGGMPGAKHLGESEALMDYLRASHEAGARVAAICAAPAMALARSGLLAGRRATCYPSFEERFPSDVTFVEERVVVDGRITTSRGPGTALAFALELVRQLVSPEAADTLREGMLAPP